MMMCFVFGRSQDFKFGDETFEVQNKVYENGISFGMNDEERLAIVTGIDNQNSNSTIQIPSYTSDGYKVVGIADNLSLWCVSENPSIYLPETIKWIGSNINWNNAKINIPTALEYIGNNAFKDATITTKNIALPYLKHIGDDVFLYADVVNVTIGSIDFSNIEYIGNNAFFHANITTENIVLPNLKHIGDNAFFGQENIKTIDLSESEIDTIFERTFEAMKKLKTVKLPKTTRCIGDYAFAWTNLETLTIPENVDSIGNYVFFYDTLLNLSVDSKNKSFRMYNSSLYTKDLSTIIWYGRHYYNEDVVLPYETTEIRPTTFYFNPYIKSVYAENVRKIGQKAFMYTKNLETINVPNVEDIGKAAFACPAKNFILSESLKEIPDYSFTDGNNNYFDQQIKSFRCPPNVERIGENAFSSNLQLESIQLPEALKTIDNCAFNRTGLNDITIPSNVEYIGAHAFGETHLYTVTVECTTPPECSKYWSFCEATGKKDFSICNYDFYAKLYGGVNVTWERFPHYWHNTYENATLYVPKESLELYKTTYPWSEFKKIRYIGQPEPYVLNDGETFAETETTEKEGLEYHRTFNNTEWQALYVPFSMSYDDWKDEFEIGKINDVNMYDTDDDGEFDVTEIELLKIKHGSTEANTPYFIKAKTTGDKVISLENATLYPAEENYVDCSSTEMLFTFQGTYSGVSGADMYANKYYALSGGSLCYAEDASVPLKPMRWYMKSEARNYKHSTLMNNVRVRVVGEDATGINETRADKSTQKATYMLDGRAVNPSNLKKGIYIRNGKKIVL